MVDVVAERRRHELEVGAPFPRHEAVDQDEEADGDDHERDHRPVLQRADQDAVDDDAEHERDHERQEERQPVADVPQRQLVGDVRRRHRHLPLREVDHLGGAVDEDEREREASVDDALREAGDGLLREDAARQAADDEEDARGHEPDEHGQGDVSLEARQPHQYPR